MSEIELVIIPKNIADKLYTKNCTCLHLKENCLAVDRAKIEKSIEKYQITRTSYINNYIHSVFLHTAEPLLDNNKDCRNKEYILSKSLRDALIEHIQTITIFEEALKTQKNRKFSILLPKDASNLLEIFGYPELYKAVEIHDYIEFIRIFMRGSLLLHGKLVQTFSTSKPRSLISFLKLEALTLRIFGSYWEYIKKTPKPQQQNGVMVLQPSEVGPSQLEKSSNTPI